MSRSGGSGGRTSSRAAISVAVGALTFVLLNMMGRNNTALGAGFVVTIVVWLLIAPRDRNSEEK
jgi:hypothetical protein